MVAIFFSKIFQISINEMSFKSLCALCSGTTKRGSVVVLEPCEHRFHAKCWHDYAEEEGDMPCAYCGEEATANPLIRKTYAKHSGQDRARVVQAAREGTGWVEMSKSLGIPRNTAEEWVRKDTLEPKRRGGQKPPKMSPEVVGELLRFLESDSQLTLKQLKERVLSERGVTISETTISRALHGMAYTLKKTHAQPAPMNTGENKIKRREHVQRLQSFLEMNPRKLMGTFPN